VEKICKFYEKKIQYTIYHDESFFLGKNHFQSKLVLIIKMADAC